MRGLEKDESAAWRRHAQNLLDLLTVQARWGDQPARSIVRTLLEALESMMPLDLAYVSARHAGARASHSLEILRLDRQPADERLTEWRPLLASAFGGPASRTVRTITARAQPVLRVVRVPIGPDAQGGSALFGSHRPDFPSLFHETLLHAATGPLAGGLRSAWLLEEREAVVRARDEFLAILGHELRNPLAPIVTALHLIAQRGGPATAHELEILDRQVGQVTRIVDQLLDLSRVTRGTIALEKRPIELTEIVGDALEEVMPLIEARGHRVRLDVPREGLLINGDGTRLTQLVANLLTNAAKYTDQGGQIEVVAARRAAFVELSVKDNGMGIPQDLLPSLFDIFVQGRRASTQTESLGIGLTLVKRLAELHGGSVSAHSDGPGKGSEFIIRLPIGEQTQSAAQ